MKNPFKTIILLITLIFLTTYSPSKLNHEEHNSVNFFSIKNIQVENNNLISKFEIVNKLSDLYGKNILLVNKDYIKKPLESIDFLRTIEVKKKYPDTIIINIFETKPVAVLLKDKKKFLIDNLSNLYPLSISISEDDLPKVFGEKAELNFLNFFKLLKKNSFSINNIENFYFFKVGRWDIQLTNNQIIKFPKSKTNEAIKQSIELLKRKDFKNYNIIDLRIYGKIVTE